VRASISVTIPQHNLEPGHKVLGLEAFTQTMGIVNRIAEKEAEEQFVNPNKLGNMRFAKMEGDSMKIIFQYGVSRRRERRNFISGSTYNSGWDNSSNGITLNSGTTTVRGTWGIDTATGSDSSNFTVYQTSNYDSFGC